MHASVYAIIMLIHYSKLFHFDVHTCLADCRLTMNSEEAYEGQYIYTKCAVERLQARTSKGNFQNSSRACSPEISPETTQPRGWLSHNVPSLQHIAFKMQWIHMRMWSTYLTTLVQLHQNQWYNLHNHIHDKCSNGLKDGERKLFSAGQSQTFATPYCAHYNKTRPWKMLPWDTYDSM